MLLAEGLVIEGVYVLAILGGAGTVIAFLFKLLMGAKDKETALLLAQKDAEMREKDKARADLESVKKSYQEIAAEALRSATETANYYRQREGKPPIIPLAPVVSESHSPSTAAQRETALIQTMRATMAHVKSVVGQEPRPEPERAIEPANPATTPAAPQTPFGETVPPVPDTNIAVTRGPAGEVVIHVPADEQVAIKRAGTETKISGDEVKP